jgi:hypothetical protein
LLVFLLPESCVSEITHPHRGKNDGATELRLWPVVRLVLGRLWRVGPVAQAWRHLGLVADDTPTRDADHALARIRVDDWRFTSQAGSTGDTTIMNHNSRTSTEHDVYHVLYRTASLSFSRRHVPVHSFFCRAFARSSRRFTWISSRDAERSALRSTNIATPNSGAENMIETNTPRLSK